MKESLTHPALKRGIVGRLRERWERGMPWKLVHWMQLGDAQQAWYLKRLIHLLQIDLVIDVGANNGQFARLIRHRVGYSGALLSIEPLPGAAAILRRRAAADVQWSVVEAALGDHAGSATLHVPRGHELSSLLRPSNLTSDRLASFNRVEREIQVQVLTLDQLLSQEPLAQGKKNLYLKLDVQGAELRVLRGAAVSLHRISALQAEFSVVPLYDEIPSYHEQMREIDSMGYQLSFLPAHNYTQFPDMIDFDAHFIRRDWLRDRGYLLRDTPPGISPT